MGVYRDERLAQERAYGGWGWKPRDLELKSIVNPSEETLDTLLAAREQDPHASLGFEPSTRTPMITSTFLGRNILFRRRAITSSKPGSRNGTVLSGTEWS